MRTIISNCLHCHNRDLNAFFLISLQVSVFVSVIFTLFLENIHFLLLTAGVGFEEIMLRCCEKIVVICLTHDLKLSYNLTIISTMWMITGRAIDMHRQIIV